MTSFWHPFGDMHSVQHNPFVIDRGEGIYVFDEAGKRYLDATAALWFVNLGYGRADIAKAVAKQLERLHTFHSFTDYAARPTLDLAARIAAVSPDLGSKVFLTSGGSDSIDSAAKLARRYFSLIGQPERSVFIAREWAYHGMHTYGTSLAGIESNRTGYGEMVGDIVFVPYDDAEAVEKAIDHAGSERVAGIFCEAVIGAGGVRPVPADYLTSVRESIRKAGALYISDEVITGFGRCGEWFAAGRFDLKPDLITFAKGVTCGYMPLGGVIASPRVAEPFFGQPGAMFRHGYTYSGHAAACIAGLEVMGIYEKENIFARALELEKEIPTALASLTDLDPVIGIRSGVGAMAAIQLDPSDPNLAMKVTGLCREKGLITRAIAGNGLQISPPLIMTTAELDEMADKFRAGISAL